LAASQEEIREVMEQFRKSEEDIKAGRTKSWDEFVKEFKKKKL